MWHNYKYYEQEFILSGLTPQEFQEMLINSLEQVIKPLVSAKESRSTELLTRKEAARLLRISLPTLADWTQQGIIHTIRMGRRVFYLVSDIQNALKKREG